MPQASRTLNPLHFEDLEPHRFEDLVRQLAYDFRSWHSIEATGRVGQDEGVDIRAYERLEASLLDSDSDVDFVDPEVSRAFQEREWIIQCKRERSLGPKRVVAVLEESLRASTTPPYGFILAAACDFSKRARDEFRSRLREAGVQEFFLWGKAELEDMLFQPRNDHLLFAYFNVSLQVRRRSKKTELSSRLAIKRKLVRVLGDIHNPDHMPVLIRDGFDERYPWAEEIADFAKEPAWRYYMFEGHVRPDYVGFVISEFYGWANAETEEWDYYPSVDEGWPRHPELIGVERTPDALGMGWRLHRFSYARIEPQNRARVKTIGVLPYDAILAVDEIGDAYHEGPHLLVDYRGKSPFERTRMVVDVADGFSHTRFFPEEEKRVKFFPDVIPEVTNEEFELGVGRRT